MNVFKFLIIIGITSAITFNSLAQENVKVKRKEFKVSDNGFKDAWKAIKKGNSDFSIKATYRLAREQYLKAYKYNDKNAQLNYKIGVCFLYSDNKNLAINYLKKAFDLNKEITKDIHFQMARAYHLNYEFDKAITEYKLFKAETPARKLLKMKIDIDKYITECEFAKGLLNKPVRAIIVDLGRSVNSEYDDYAAVVDSKEEAIYYASRRISKLNDERNLLDRKFSEDIYVAKKKGKDFTFGQILSKKFATKNSEAPLALSPNDKRLYIYKNNGNGDIYYTDIKEGAWSKPKSFSRINSRSRETALSFTGDGKKLYFVSDRADKKALGGKDIYMSEQNAKGKWNKPVNIGGPVNTTGNEEAVYISKDGKTLYFSSKGFPTMGGYDIFKSTLSGSGNWSQPENLGYPINTPDDDMFLSMMDNGRTGYISGIRENTIGERDIYKVIYLGEEKIPAISIKNSSLAFELYDKRMIIKKMPETLLIDSSIMLSGKVLDMDSKKGVMAKLQFIDSEKSTVVATLLSDSTGAYKTRIPQKKIYGVEISARGYLFFLDAVDTKKAVDEEVTKDFMLQGLEVGAKVVLKNIFFETGKATLKEESFQQLSTVVEFMQENPTLTLEISGHTDNVGSLAANLKLSEARAKSVVDYIVSQKIESSRLTFKGYGSNQPVAPNTTKDGKAKNRRVEFKITGK